MKIGKKSLNKLQTLILCFAMVTTIISPSLNVFALSNEHDKTDSAEITRSLDLSYKLNDTSDFIQLNKPYEIPDISEVDKFNAKYSFTLKETTDEDGNAIRNIKSGDYYLIDLPSQLQIINPTDSSVLDDENKPIANYTFLQKQDLSWHVKVEFTEYVDDVLKHDIHGSLKFEFAINIDNDANTNVNIPIDNQKQIIINFNSHNQTSNSDIERKLLLKYKLKGSSEFVELNAPYKIEDSSKVEAYHANFKFRLKDNIDENQQTNRTVKNSDYYLIDLPDKLQIKNPMSGNILGNHDKPIANYSFLQKSDLSWQVKIEFTEYIDDPNEYEIYGEMEFDFILDLSSVGEGTTTTIYIPIDNENNIEIDITKPVPLPTTPTSLIKTVSSYNHLTRKLIWNIQMMPEQGVFSGRTFTDTIDTDNLRLKSIRHGNVNLTMDSDYTFDATTGKITYNIPDGRDGKTFQNIRIVTEVKRDIYGNTSPTTIKNQANLSGGEAFVDINSNIARKTITPNWLTKQGTLYEGNKIKWTIKANITNQSMYNAVITDSFDEKVTLIKSSVELGGTIVKVYDNSHTPADNTEIYGVYIKNSDRTSELKIYLPRGKDNVSTANQTITLLTDVVSPDTADMKNNVYNNTASLDCNFVTDGDGVGAIDTVKLAQIGVGVPDVYINKTHSELTGQDKRNGTITWKISAASNVSSYGKSQIIDTLPDDQEFIADEIYYGSQKINETTEPKAEISSDLRTLTITFSNDNALKTQQTFAVKTKINSEIYGDNINRFFTNNVQSSLFSTTDDILIFAEDTDRVRIENSVISKTSSKYNGNNTKAGQNPRIDFNITINSNLMPLSDVIVSDDLSRIVAEFKNNSDTTFNKIDGGKCTYVPDTLTITKNAGSMDSLNLDEIAARSTYENDIITVDFGNGVHVNDKYTITFTVELDVSQNPIFKENGVIRCKGNIADIVATGLKTGTISTLPTTNSAVIKNEVLGKHGANMVKEQQVLWTINLNQHRVQLDNTRVMDILPYGITLDPTSIKLYKNVIGTDGNFITGNDVEIQGEEVDFDYTYYESTQEGMEGRYTLVVTLPDDSTDYILRFATDVEKNILGTRIENSAYYVGESEEQENSNTKSIALSSTSGGGSTTKSSITVNKLNVETGEKVNGAVFALHWLRNGDADNPTFVRNLTATNGSVTFYGLKLGEKYTVTEVNAPNGYLIDNKNPVEFTTPSNSTQTLEPINFYNTPIKTGTFTPKAIKKLDGKSIIHPFNFEITDGTNLIMTGVTKTELANGDFVVEFNMKDGVNPDNILNFSNIHHFNNTDELGTEFLVSQKIYKMREIASELSGYGFDDKIYTLVVKVYNVKGRNDLKVVIEDGEGNVLSNNDGNFLIDKTPVFLNTYRANGAIQLTAIKNLVGQPLYNDQFSFELYDGNTLMETVNNKVGIAVNETTYSGNIDFSTIKYNQSDVGTKTYTIKEKQISNSNYIYDTAVYTVVVNITDKDDGTLTSSIKSISKTVKGKTTDENIIEFTNTYKNIDVSINATKILKNRQLQDEQFNFVLDEVTASGEFIREIQQVSNNQDGVIKFDDIIYTPDDIGKTYYYTISEINENNSSYKYDSSVYNLSIEVIDKGDSTLGINKTIKKNENIVDKIEFVNSYNPPHISVDTDKTYTANGYVDLHAKKILNGLPLIDKMFSFVLIDDSNGDILQTVYNDKNGDIPFDRITYNQNDIGTHKYVIFEVPNDKKGITYDNSVYLVTVNVIDNGDGSLKTQTSIVRKLGNEQINVNYMEFINNYNIEQVGVPNTGTNSSYLWFILISLLCCAVALVEIRKRVLNNKL